ncbi:hypothetical protein BC939DRAFT_469894 [Gamsiella multidivaricata]|uniref:uncharacterized protein n=1 Tax=Gamsiella multidivaricata TaxID=101098 RepID=UPI00221FD4C6|nr:uncharacterized protein BC939DRAFT_469894 [Gamsiella multidivaricata]KAG0368583.1 hypothetical protein BGZ54_001610 [Gamsiella multidivaricata]KAI7816225.1 hypothetical protein BC939DRAFT_469894 [Gamsiella multidivaricata]
MKLTQHVVLLSLSMVAALTLLSLPSTTTHALPANHRSKSSLSLSHASVPKHRPKATPSLTHKSPKKKSKKNTNGSPSKQHTGQLKAATTSPIPSSDPPLLLLPESNSVWHAGSVESVRWSKKYAKRLPKDTTVDIILVDSRTNKKIHSLKRFIPFRKGSAQVWVPSKIPEDASVMLVLELYHGLSQQPAVVETKALNSTTTAAVATTTTTTTATAAAAPKTASAETTTTTTKNIPSILRRSDINITRRARRAAPDQVSTTTSAEKIAHDINDDDYYTGDRETQPLEFFPDELRQEYPNVVKPIELEHTFGLHQKVYTMAPYTLAWKIPERVAELLEYTQARLRLMMDKSIDLAQHRTLRDNTKNFIAKILVELVQDQTLELVSVLARNVPAETKFQYLQIHDRVPPAFYRLKVQMVVVEIQGAPESVVGSDSVTDTSRGRHTHGDYMDGWDFPSGGRVIDRYESITRRFWVSAGAL